MFPKFGFYAGFSAHQDGNQQEQSQDQIDERRPVVFIDACRMAAIGIGADRHDDALAHGCGFAVHRPHCVGNEQCLPLVLPGGDLHKEGLIAAIGILGNLVRLAAIRKNLQYGARLILRIVRRLRAVRFLIM